MDFEEGTLQIEKEKMTLVAILWYWMRPMQEIQWMQLIEFMEWLGG